MFFKSLLELDTRDEVCNCFFKKKNTCTPGPIFWLLRVIKTSYPLYCAMIYDLWKLRFK